MPNMRLLHSGFLAYPKADLGKAAESEGNFRTAVHQQSVIGIDTANWYDVEVDAMRDRITGEHNAIKDFDFREAVLRKAMELFGAPAPFSEWFAMQRFSPAVTYMHRRFLIETLDFIYANKPRKMSLATYRDVLAAGLTNEAHTAADKTGDFADLFSVIKDLRSISNTDFFSAWTKDTEGLIDLVLTMDVIFGLRVTKG